MSLVNLVIKRALSTTGVQYGKRNFKKFSIYNKRGSRILKEQRVKDPNHAFPHDKRGVRDVGYHTKEGEFIPIPEKIPEIIVPDLAGCSFKPYVSYRTPDVVQSEFTAQQLFNVVYAPKIAKDLREGKLNEDGSPKEPSPHEKLTAEEAKNNAAKTGTDLFQ